MAEPTVAHDQPVLYEVDRGVSIITLNRPDRLNAWTPEMGSLYSDHLEAAAADPSVRVIVVTGAGRGFCAGADMARLQAVGGGSAVVGEEASNFPSRALTIPKPVIAAINGPCAGLGFVIALMCDLRFAAAGAKLTTSFVRRGLIAEYGSAWLLPRLVGPARALDLLLSGRILLAEEALALGVVNQVFAVDGLMPGALDFAHDLAQNCSPASMAVIKRQVYGDLGRAFEPALEDSLRLMMESLRTADFAEGVASYVEQRPPRFEPLPEEGPV